MYAQHLAWLHGKPKISSDDKAPKARVEKWSETDYRRVMPDITGGESLVLHWHECGMYGSGANGAIPLSWQELRAYSQQSGVMLDGWDSKHIIRMSRAYVNMKGQADNKDCFAPYQRILSEEEIIIRDNEIFEEFKRMRAARK